MKRLLPCTIILLVTCAGAFADIDLSVMSSSGSGDYAYSYDIAAGACDITTISFDYSYGDTLPSSIAKPGFRIRRLNDDGSDSWIGSFNIHSGSFNLDTDYGPYSNPNSPSDLSGTVHYEFTLNRSNGLWELALNGAPVDFYPLSSTNAIQPDGYAVVTDTVIENKYFSDESAASHQNAIDLGWAGTGNANDGVGGTGAYRLQFIYLQGATGAFVDNIETQCVPVPGAILLVILGLSAAGVRLRRRS